METNGQTLHILFLEDSGKDIEIISQKLKDGLGSGVVLDIAGNEAEYLDRIAIRKYDVILADHTLPGFDAFGALRHRQALCPQTPFICVSGTIGEDNAVEMLKQGATDYVLKDRLGRLCFAVLRALEDAKKEAERKCTELELIKARERYEEAQHIAHIGSWKWDLVNQTVNWTEEMYRIFGLDPKTALYPGITYQCMSDEDEDKLRGALDAAIQHDRPYDLEFTINRPDGSIAYAHTKGQAQKDAEGRPTSITGTVQDITDRKRAEEESYKRTDTEARLRVMTEFFTNVSHELKTPLSLILMQIDMMRAHLGDGKRMQKLLEDATLNSYRLTRLVNNLLDITKMDAGFMTLNLRRRDIVNAIRYICDSVAGYAAAKSITLEFSSEVPEKQMDVDREKLDRVLLNLLSNAIKHTPAGGRITVEIRERQGRVRVFVKDTGDGIPADKLGSIFDRFVQVNNRLNRQTEGCGIGLALVKSMVELHGGSVWAESESGKGSLFVVELPATVSEDRKTQDIVESFEMNKKVAMELSDLYIKTGA